MLLTRCAGVAGCAQALLAGTAKAAGHLPGYQGALRGSRQFGIRQVVARCASGLVGGAVWARCCAAPPMHPSPQQAGFTTFGAGPKKSVTPARAADRCPCSACAGHVPATVNPYVKAPLGAPPAQPRNPNAKDAALLTQNYKGAVPGYSE